MQHIATETEDLTAPQEQSIVLYASGMSISDVARKLGIERSTIYRWMKQAKYSEALTDYRAGLRLDALMRMHDLTDESLDVLEGILTEKRVKYGAAVRLRAAQFVLDMVFNRADPDDVSQRITELERQREQDRMRRFAPHNPDDNDPFSPVPFGGG